MRNAVYILQIVGFITSLTCFVVMTCLVGVSSQQPSSQPIAITGSLG